MKTARNIRVVVQNVIQNELLHLKKTTENKADATDLPLE